MRELTAAMRRAIELAGRNGGFVAAGANVLGGCVFYVNARTLDGLIARGLARHTFTSEGGYGVFLIEGGE